MSDHAPYPGASWKEVGNPVALAAFEDEALLAVALADGRIDFRLLDKPETQLKEITAHTGGLCALIPAGDGASLLSGGEDGKLLRIDADGGAKELAHFSKAWVEQLAAHESGLVAASYKKTAVLFGADGKILGELPDHPSTISGLAFDSKGKRLAVSHYGGVSLWWVGGGSSQTPQRLKWKGSHLEVRFSPNGKFLLTAMQENTLHGWRLADGADFAMSGYARKPRFHWNVDGHWLASAGSAGIVCWDCSGKGPMGRGAAVLAPDSPDLTVQVACHPRLDLVAAGTEKGGVYLARFQDDSIVNLKTTSEAEIVFLSWSPSGRYLLAGAEDGTSYMWAFDEGE